MNPKLSMLLHWRILTLVPLLLALAGCVKPPASETTVPQKTTGVAVPAHAPEVIGWIPAYGVQAAEQALASNPAIAKGLTRIGLQFWNPSKDGTGVVLAPIGAQGTPVDPAAIERVRDWAHARGIKVLLTIYNNSETTKTWDWAWALRAFRDHQDSFIHALVKEMNKYGLDGIDVDLEGNGALDGDRAAFAGFVKALSKALRAQDKLLTIDTFHSPCYNAPNMSWWKDWAGQVDTLHVMGYADLYEASTATFQPKDGPVCANGAHIFKYSWQMAYGIKAGYRPDQIAMGMPGWTDQWGTKGQETSAESHIHEVQKLGGSVAIWDLQLSPGGWRSNAVWNALVDLRKHPGSKDR